MSQRPAFARFLCTIALLVGLAACGRAAPLPTPEPSATPPPAASPTAPATATAAATATPAATATVPPTATPEGPVLLGELGQGEAERGSIEETGDETIWTLEGAEDEMIYIFAEALRGDVEPFITLRASDGSLIASSERSDERGSATLTEILPDDDTYSVVVASYGNGTGNYEIIAYTTTLGGELQIGETVTSVLIGGETEDVWTFEAEAGDFVNVEVSGSNDLDTYITLTDEDGYYLGDDDDGGDEMNPRLRNFPLLAGGTYRLTVAAYSDSVGPYDLTLERGEATGGGTVTLDQPAQDELDAGDSHLWTFDGEAGTTLDILANATSDGLDPAVALFGPSGELINSDEDRGGDLNARLTRIELFEGGSYAIVVSSQAETSGAYELIVRASQAEPLAAGAIGYGQTMTGTLADGLDVAWTFEAQPGQVVEIALKATEGDLDSYLTLLDPNGVELVTDDDSGGNYDPLIVGFPVLITGTHEIVLSTVSGNGSYELILTQGQPSGGGQVAYGETVEGALAEGRIQFWTFQGTEGDTVEAILTAAVEGLDLKLALYSPAGDPIASDDDGGGDLNPLLTGVDLPATGTYTLLVTTFNNGSGGYTLELTGQ